MPGLCALPSVDVSASLMNEPSPNAERCCRRRRSAAVMAGEANFAATAGKSAGAAASTQPHRQLRMAQFGTLPAEFPERRATGTEEHEHD